MISGTFPLKAAFVTFLLMCFSVRGQTETELVKSLKKCKSDSLKCLILSKLRDKNLDYFALTKFDSAYYSISKENYLTSKSIRRKKYYSFHYAESLRRIVNVDMAYGKTKDRDLTRLNYVLKLYKFSNKTKFISATYLEKGYYFYCNSDFKNALLNYQKGLRIAESVKADYEISLALNNIATLHSDVKNYQLSLNYYKRCLEKIKQGNDPYAITTVTANVGLTYYHLKNYSSAEFFLNKSIYLARRSSDVANEERVLCFLGDVFMETKKYEKALSTYNQALALSNKNNYTNGMVNSQLRLSNYWLEKGDLQLAESFGEKAYQQAELNKNQGLIQNAAEQLILVYKASKNYKKVIELTEVFDAITDSINSEDTENKLLESKYEYEYDRKAISDSIQQVREKQVYSLQIEKDRNSKLFLVVFILLVLIFTVLIYNRYKIAQKQKSVIEQNNRDLERQHVMNQKIFSVISHDFRGPMLSLQYLLQSLQTTTTNHSINQLIQDVNAEVGTASEILENLLNWARTEIGINHFEQRECNVKVVFDEVEKEFMRKLTLKNLTIQKEIEDNTIKLPADILRIVLRNLLSNACKFSHENSAISVKFNSHVLVVEDKGIGISQSKMDNLFKQEIDTGLGTNNEEGFGIGLYIVSELLNKYHYQITVESTENLGTQFFIREK
jgi:signal transduction histidine kinase